MFEDLNASLEIEHSMIEAEKDEQGNMKCLKRPRNTDPSQFHFKRTDLDIAFAWSITDEILNLEPLQDKFALVKQKYQMDLREVCTLMRQRLSFFSIFNLFDTV